MFWETFSELCANRKVKPGKVTKEIGVSNSAATHWKKGKVPHYDTLLKIAAYFGVSVDRLLRETPETERDELSLRCAAAFAALPTEKQREMVALLEFVRDQVSEE